MAGDVVFVFDVADPRARVPVAVGALEHQRGVVLVPTVDPVALGVEFTSIAFGLPVVIPVRRQVPAR